MKDAGKRRAATGANVGRGAGDGASCSEATKEWRDDVGQTLCHEFLVGVMSVIDGGVRNASRE